MSTNKFGIDIFSGAGGLSLGAENAGITVSLAIEKDEHASKTFITNHPHATVISEDIRGINPLEYIKDTPFIVFGGPPCQGFSHSNTKTRNIENDNNSLFNEFLRFVNVLQPEWFLFENVEGITTFDKGNTIIKIKESFEQAGYLTQSDILYASDYGVPQHRNRFFLVGNRKGIDFKFPEKLDSTVNVKDAISDLPTLVNGASFTELPYKSVENLSNYAKKMRGSLTVSKQNYVSKNKDYVLERYPYIKPGQNWKAIPERLMLNYAKKDNCHSGIYKRLEDNKPSIVISNYRKNMLIHPSENRGLSVREAARLQSFPDDFIFEGSLTHIQQQIGNAVPPLLAESIFKQIIKLNDAN